MPRKFCCVFSMLSLLLIMLLLLFRLLSFALSLPTISPIRFASAHTSNLKPFVAQKALQCSVSCEKDFLYFHRSSCSFEIFSEFSHFFPWNSMIRRHISRVNCAILSANAADVRSLSTKQSVYAFYWIRIYKTQNVWQRGDKDSDIDTYEMREREENEDRMNDWMNERASWAYLAHTSIKSGLIDIVVGILFAWHRNNTGRALDGRCRTVGLSTHSMTLPIQLYCIYIVFLQKCFMQRSIPLAASPTPQHIHKSDLSFPMIDFIP